MPERIVVSPSAAFDLWGLLACALLAAAPPTHAASADWNASWAAAQDRGWLEAIISVRDTAPLQRFARDIAGWQEHHRGRAGADVVTFYGAQPAAKTQPRDLLIGDATRTPGMIRVMAFGDARAVAIRGGANPWDTGGILSLMTRSNRTPTVLAGARAQGWTSFSDIVELFLSDMNVKLTNVIVRGPDDVAISVYERLEPRMPDDADLRQLRRPFNSMQAVRNIDTARRFYLEVLGFALLRGGDFHNAVRAPNNFGVPANLVVAQPIGFAIVGPHRDGPTQVELVQMRGVEGRDLAQRAVPPNLGILGLRFPVSNLDALSARLQKYNWPLARPATELTLAPWGRVRLLAVQSPDGAWLEFMQRLAP